MYLDRALRYANQITDCSFKGHVRSFTFSSSHLKPEGSQNLIPIWRSFLRQSTPPLPKTPPTTPTLTTSAPYLCPINPSSSNLHLSSRHPSNYLSSPQEQSLNPSASIYTVILPLQYHTWCNYDNSRVLQSAQLCACFTDRSCAMDEVALAGDDGDETWRRGCTRIQARAR
ncbi:hypothetical protein P280DRAFT_215958 [Massarina eburnea CBS 473.64]|uniref:Uncharacterized protein n=1 Tax=Massarina eburnea CBS 473.64 TaxID=1395130 RepID=A0A6A6S948_9PLEO|nr:hypothetical protein P280DRAFT_215958 [Massarina eburnea CBS 473.64]